MGDTVLTTAQAQHAELGITASTPLTHTSHPEAQWFSGAGLGLFIHWGIAAVHGNLDLSWAMMANTPWDASENGRNKVTPDTYWKLAERFQPTQYDPEPWIAAAAKAGFRYAVLTTMHHDGYTLWPSRHSNFGVQSYLAGRDLVGPFIDACRRHGLKVGLYYSPPDWHFDRDYRSFNYGSDSLIRFTDRPALDVHHQPVHLPATPQERISRRREIFHRRVEELLTRWGRIDLMWFDGGPHDDQILPLVRRLQPHVVVNSRVCNGDYAHSECSLPEQRPQGWFETCHCWQASDIRTASGGTVDVWGYLENEKYKSTVWMLEQLVKLRAWGANFLINVGPGPTGRLPDIVYERFEELAGWMRHSQESVIGADAGPFPPRSNVPVTVRGDRYYLHALKESDGQLELRDVPRPRSVLSLRTGEAITPQWNAGRLLVQIPAALRTPLVDVVAVQV